MAFLKETERSLRAYFIVVGVVGLISGLVSLGAAAKTALIERPIVVTLTLWFLPLVHLVLGSAFIVAGITLKRALRVGAARTKQLVLVAVAATMMECVLGVVALNSLGARQDAAEIAGRAFGRALIPLLIFWYIYASLGRLANESRQRVLDTVSSKFS
jgi:uncharacterized membrane protein